MLTLLDCCRVTIDGVPVEGVVVGRTFRLGAGTLGALALADRCAVPGSCLVSYDSDEGEIMDWFRFGETQPA